MIATLSGTTPTQTFASACREKHNMPTHDPYKPPRKEDVQAAIDACLDNGARLLDDALQLEFQEKGGTRFMISILAQEEYAKAFLLYWVREEIIPWDDGLRRVLRNHACKHLVAITMEYLDPEWETIEELRAIINAEYDLEGAFPPRVSSALNILYHEKIRGRNFDYDDGDYEPSVIKIAKGERDRLKQDSVFVALDKSCRVKQQNSPMNITRDQAQTEYKRAERYASIVLRLIEHGGYKSIQMDKFKEATREVFWQRYKPFTEPK
jgi:AbiV family abortive infection protein